MPADLPSVRRTKRRKKLRKLLSMTDVGRLALAIWTIDAAQNKREQVALKYMKLPEGAINPEIASKDRAHEWTMDTLFNEALLAPRSKPKPGKRYRELDCLKHPAFAELINATTGLENAEAGVYLRDDNALNEMQRIVKRQIEWQRGATNIPLFYKFSRLFHFEAADQYFTDQNRINLNQFSKFCFGLYSQAAKQPYIQATMNCGDIGISDAERDAALPLLALDQREMTDEAKRLRREFPDTGYKPSVLRQKPCLYLDNGTLICPLIDFVILRCTAGIYYDLVGNADLRNDIGANLENYCLDLINAYFETTHAYPEIAYKKGNMKTPDILLANNEGLRAVVECKAKKQTVNERFSLAPLEENNTGYDEIVKGVFQIWRFFCHLRLGLVRDAPGEPVPDVFGVVVTLDDWMDFSTSVKDEIFERAKQLAENKDGRIEQQDMKDVLFLSLSDLEELLASVSEDNFFALAQRAREQRYKWWGMLGVLNETEFRLAEPKKYPFGENLGDVLPWWNELEQLKRAEQS